ncbi:MAG: type IV pilin [Candidatus Poseidoniales archaeon]|nr:MAG: type IV pilin [Candidatus Poseidoniales archaeon]
MKEMKNKRGKTVFGGVGIALLLCLLMVMMPFASTVSNGDTTEEISTEANSERIETEDSMLDGTDDSTFNAESYGYDADYEMIGMREQNSKVFIADDGGLDMVYSSEPLHYIGADNTWQDIDFTIESSQDGFEVTQTESPVHFESEFENGYSALFGGEFEITSGVDSMLVAINTPLSTIGTPGIQEESLGGVDDSSKDLVIEINPLYFETSKNTLTGGNKISYPLSDTIDLTYTVKQDKVKQEVVINALPHMYAELPEFRSSEYFGLYERFEIPVGHKLVSSDGYDLTGTELYQTNRHLSIVNIETGLEVVRIEAPIAHQASLDESTAEITSTYFLSVDEFGTSGSIITAIETSSLLSKDVSFPVTIDPTFNYVATGQNNYPVCDISENNCHSKTDGRYEYNNWGQMLDSPRFPFQFSATLPNGNALSPIESVTAKIYYDGDYDSGYADVIILEDCGISASGAPTGTNYLGQYANPSGCTGNALQAYSPPTSTGNPLYTYDPPTSRYRHYCTSWSNYCQHFSHFGYDNSNNYGFGYYVTADDGSSTNGIFPAGTYNWEVKDSYGDGMNNNANFRVYTRNAGGSVTNTMYGWSYLGQYTTGGSSSSGTFTVPAGQEFVLRYYCPSSTLSGCYTNENLMTIQQQSGTSLPSLSNGGNSLARGPDATLALGGGQEARMKWTCGTWCGENTIYWREAGQSWSGTNSWSPNYGSGQNYQTYYSNTEGVLIQNSGGSTMNLEFLVYDSYGDGTNGGSGLVQVDSLGTWGTVPATPWGLRQVSMTSSESLGYFNVPYTGGTGTRTVNLCTTTVECNDQSSPLAMLTDAVANAGYIEFGLGFANSPVSQSPDKTTGAATTGGGEFYVDKFELIIDFEEASDDTTPPVDMTEVHYQGNSYIEGPRTLMLEIEDSEHAIDTTAANGPKLWYSIDNSNYISAPATLMSSVCNAKEQTCAFTAQTIHLSHGNVVDYYWTYQDASAPTASKPNQGANPTQTSTVQFTLVDPLNAGTAQKMTTLVENVKANYDGGAKTPGNTIDRQMTYFADTNEYLFEFDTSECETYTSAGYSCFSTNSNNDYGHWDVIWQDAVNACSPGSSGCTGTSDNSLTLESLEGGQFDISRQLGVGTNLAFKYDTTAGAWVAVGVGDGSNGLRIQDRLDANAPDTVAETNGAVQGLVASSFTPSTTPTYTIGPGDYQVYSTDSYGDGPNGGVLRDGPGGNVLISGYSGNGGPSGASSTTVTVAAGTTMTLTYTCASWCYETTIYVVPALPDSQTAYSQTSSGNSYVWDNWGFTIDLSTTTFTGSFGEIDIGANDANIVCVTTNGLVYFMDTTSAACDADADASSVGGTWNGFALGASVQGEQPGKEGMLWSVRNIAPDPDITAPSIVHTSMGDSHALERTVSAIISDPGYQPTGLEVSSVADVGPTLHYEVYKTSGAPTGTFVSVPMVPEGDRALCADMECTWSADLPALSSDRDDSVVYKITAQDVSAAGGSANNGPNTATTSLATFKADTPTNTLVIEWQDYASNFAATDECSFQLIMYDVTNEFEFHYDESCSSDEVVGVIGHRLDQNTATTIENLVDSTQTGNPHSYNIRVTDGADGYSYEYFELGLSTPLPLASSNPAVAAGTSASFRTENCVQQFWSQLSNYCAGNIDIPAGFSFDFHGVTYDGDNGQDDRIQVSAAGVVSLLQNQPATSHTTVTPVHGVSWSGAMYDMDSTSPFYLDNSIAPWWSPASNDYCAQSNGCNGVWYRTIPFDGQGTPVTSDINVDTVWYLVDSPIRVNPTDSSGYLSVNANLEIEAGVEVIVAADKGISFDSGFVNGACTQFTVGDSSQTGRVSFNADQTTDPAATWYGLAFTDECQGATTDRHVFENVDISNTEFAAITAGSRPGSPSAQYTCGTPSQDCNVGEFEMTGMTFTNVDSAFAHGSGQGTVVTMSNFDVNGARSACFNFAENTIATLSGTPSNPSTMTNCNSANKDWGGAIVSEPGSTGGSLIMSNVLITDSLRTLVRVDFKTVVISSVVATNAADQNPASTAGTWAGDNSGVSLGLSHGSGASVDISDFSAPSYHHGWIYAAGSISMSNVDLGNGWTNSHYFDIKPFGSSGTTAGATGSDATFDDVTVANLYIHRTFPGTLNDITTSGVLNFYGMSTFAQDVELTGSSVIGGEVGVDGCGSNVMITGATIGGIWSSCNFGNKNVIDMTDTTIIHDTPGTSAMFLSLTKATLIEVDVQSSVIDGTSGWYAYVNPGSELYLIASTYTDTANSASAVDCADVNGATNNCLINFNSGFGQYASEVYYGGYANALAYRLGVVNGVPQQQILQSDVTITTQTLDSTGSVIAEVGSAITGTSPMGKTDKVVVLTGNQGGDVYSEHIVRASGAAGIGDVKPGDLIAFSNEVAQTPGTVFGDYTIGSYVDIRLIAPPVTFDSPNMDCNWMMNTNSTFMNAYDSVKDAFVFKGAALTVAADMTFDGCSIELEGSKMLFRSGTVTVMSNSITNTDGSILMTIDGDTGDAPEIIGENGAKVVDLDISLGGTVNMQAGTIQDMLVSNFKDGLLVVGAGGTLIMAGGAQILGSDLTGMGLSYPIVYADGGNIQVTTGQISGIGNTGAGLATSNAFVNANGLTVSNAYAGVWGEDSALTLDGFTSTSNTYGVVAEGAMTLPKIYRSATLQGIDVVNDMDACIYGYWNACGYWKTYSVDFSTYLGSQDYLQTGMEITFQGHIYDPYSGWTTPYVSMDNLKIKMSDNLGQTWTVDSSSDKGYYPYGSADPASGTTAATYTPGAIGGVPTWECSYQGFTYSPYSSFGAYGSRNFAGPGTMGDFFGVGAWGYPAEFGFRWTASDNPNIPGDPFPGFNWGTTHRYFSPYANFPGMNNRAPSGTVCGAVAQPAIPTLTQAGSSGILNFPVVDISDTSLTSVTMEVDVWHTYYHWRAGYHDNDVGDNTQIMARGSSNPAALGDWSTTLPNNGISIINSNINDADVGIDLRGDTVATFTDTVITNPSSFGVNTDGENSVTFDDLEVTDNTGAGLQNYGFFSGTTSSGDITIKDSDFSGLHTSLYFNNDVGTTVESTSVSGGDTGLRIGSQSDANYNLDGLTITNMDTGVDAAGTGKLTIKDCVFVSSNSFDVVIDDSRNAEFIDGSFSVKPLDDSSKVSVSGSGTLERSRSYFAVLDADSSPVANANVILSSRDASVFSAGTTDSNGLASGLAFSVFTMDSVGINDLTSLFNTYTITTVAQIGTYSYTDATTNSGDFRYKIASPTLVDEGYDSSTSVNYESYSLTDVVDVRICSNDNMHTVVASCAGTFADTDTRTYTSGMVEYGSEESIQDLSGTVDLSNMVIMSDTGSYEMKDGTTYNLDGSTILMTGYMGLYNIGQWTVEQPYGTTFSMDGGSVLGIYPEAPSGAPVGYALGGLGGFSDAPLSFDVNNVDFNGIATMSAFAGDYASSSSWSGMSAYNVGTFEVTGSSFSHFRGFNSLYANSVYDIDTCIRVAGGSGGLIQNNIFSDCTAGILFTQSDWLVDDSDPNTGATDDRYTTTPHPVNGSLQFTVDNNQFSGGAGFNVWVYNDANADQLTITNNDMNCNACEAHIAFYDETSVAPIITGNTIRNGDYAVTTKDTQLVTIDSNIISDIEVAAVYVDGGDADVTDNTITDSLGGIRVEGLTKPTEQVTYLVAGINTGMPQSTTTPFSYRNFLYGTYSDEISYTLEPGDEMIMDFTCGAYCYESEIRYKGAGQAFQTWDPNGATKNSLSDNLLFTAPGVYKFKMYDSYGDGPNGGSFRVLKAASGTWTLGSTGGPATVLSWTHNTLHSQYATGTGSNDDGIVIENLGTTPTTWAFRMTDTFGDGANGNSYIIEEAPAGTWAGTSGPSGAYVGGINDGIGPSFTNSNNNGDYSDWLEITLQPNKELRMVWDNCNAWCYESGMEYGEIAQSAALTWVGPDIHNNVITNTGFEPNAYGIRIESCDMTQYHISTISNTVNIGQDALVADSCTWKDQGSTLTGTDQAGSVGFNDDNTYGALVVLSGTTISGFETGILKTSGDLTVLSSSTVTAGANGIGLSTSGIDVILKDSTFDGGASGLAVEIIDSTSSSLDNVDTQGTDGVKFVNSEFTWTGGAISNSGVALEAEDSTGDVTSLTYTGTGTQISASDETYINSIDYSLDEAKMVVDATSIVDESNWLSISTDHLGSAPASQVGLMITDSSGNYGAYVSPTFNADSLDNTMTVDGLNDDWVGGNALNPSGYAMPGEVSTDFFVTASSSTLYMAFNGVTSADDLYVYFNTNDLAGSDTDYNDEHTLPFGAEQALVIDSTGSSIYSSGLTGWTLAAGAVQLDRTTSFVEVAMPLSSLGSSVDSLDIVAMVQVGTDVSVAHPSQTIVGTGLETLTDSYSMNLGLLDLSDGTMTDQVMLYRSFFKSSTPTTGHTYDIMVKTEAVAGQTCDYDWATLATESLTPILMDQSQSVSFDILRACPEITSALDDVEVIEIQTGYESSSIHDFVLATLVDDEQDVEANMKWDITGDNLEAWDNILTDWTDVTDADGTISITPINDQFGTFELEFVVVDSHGQTDSRTITYTVTNVNDAPWICDALANVDPDCSNGNIELYTDGVTVNTRYEGFTSTSKALGDVHNDTGNSFVRDMDNENNFPLSAQTYTWTASADCDQFTEVKVGLDANGKQVLNIVENVNWEEGGICDITLNLEDDGVEFCFDTATNAEVTTKPESDTRADCESAGFVWLGENTAQSVVVPFSVAPVNDEPVIADDTTYNNNNGVLVDSADSTVAWVADGVDYKVTLVEDTTDSDTLTFDLSSIKSDIDHLDADLSWTLTDSDDCDSSNYYTHQINGDILEFTLIPDATTNAPLWEMDMLNNNGIHQVKPTNAGNCPMHLTLYDDYDDYVALEGDANHVSSHPRYTNYTLVNPSSYVPLRVEVDLYVTVDNVKENVPDYEFRADSGFNFNSVTNIMPGTYVPVDFTIFSSTTTGDEGPYTYERLLKVTVHSDGHTELERPVYYTPPAYGESLFIDDWQVFITDTTTEVWVEMDVVTCVPNTGPCTPTEKVLQQDTPSSHLSTVGANPNPWSEPGKSTSNRAPAFEDRNWCNNLMSTNAVATDTPLSTVVLQNNCQHTSDSYIAQESGFSAQQWQNTGQELPNVVGTIGALSVASFAPSLIAVCMTGLFVSVLVFSSRREDDEEESNVDDVLSADESAVSPVIATILMVAITVVLSGVVYVWAAQLADTDTKGVPIVTFTSDNVDSGSPDTDHWKIVVGQAASPLATQAVEVSVTYVDSAGDLQSITVNLGSTDQVYGFTPYNSPNSIVTFSDLVDDSNPDELVSSFGAGDEIYVRTHIQEFDSAGTPTVLHPLVDARVSITYSPPVGDGALLKTYTGMTWNEPV